MRTTLSARRAGLAILTMALVAGTARGQDPRTWKDESGKFSIRAKFVSVDDGKLTLAGDDGAEVEVELKKLCQADQKYVADLLKEKDNPFKPARPGPFKPKKPATAAARAGASAAGPASTSTTARPVVADWSDARTRAMAPERADWEAAVGAPAVPPAFKARSIAIPPKSGFFERLKGMVVSADGKHAALGYTVDEPKPAGITRLVGVDLEKGKATGSAVSPGLMAPMALSDDGTRVMMRRDEFGFGNADRLELWTINGPTIAKGISFFPYDDAKGGDRDVKWAAFLANDRAITVSAKGKLALWDIDSAKVVYTLAIQDGTVPALGPDRKLLAFTTGKEVGILDVESGAVLGLKPAPNTPFAALAFSPSGKKFAVAAIDKLRAYDTATGALQAEMLLTGVAANGEVQWTDEDHVLIGHQYLLDLDNQVRLWQYQGAERAAQVGPTTLMLAEEGHQGPGALVATQLPQPSAKAALARAIADPDFFVLKPGAVVRVVVNDITDPARRPAVAAALAGKLETAGAKAGPAGTLELVASTEVGKQRDIIYQTMGRGFGAKNYKVQEYISRVKFVYQGKVAWESSTYNIPHMVMLRDGQTMEAYLKEQEKPNYDFFTSVELPGLLTRPTGAPTLGSSRVTAAGVR